MYYFSLRIMKKKSLSQSEIMKLIRFFLKLWLDIIMFQDCISCKQSKLNGDNVIENGSVLKTYFWFFVGVQYKVFWTFIFCDKAT